VENVKSNDEQSKGEERTRALFEIKIIEVQNKKEWCKLI